MSNNETHTQEKSALEKFKLFFEHTSDSRVLVHRQRVVRPTNRSTASRK